MYLRHRIDSLLAGLHALADAPDATSVIALQEAIRSVAEALPQPLEPDGNHPDDALRPIEPARSETASACGVDTLAVSFTPWPLHHARAVADGAFAGVRPCLDSPCLVDLVGGPLIPCPAVSCYQTPPDCPSYVPETIQVATNLTIHEGGLVGDITVEEFDSCLSGSYEWH